MVGQIYLSMIECPKYDWHVAFCHKKAVLQTCYSRNICLGPTLLSEMQANMNSLPAHNFFGGFFFKLGSSSSCCDKNICYNTIYYIVPGGLTLREGLSLVEDIYDTGCLRALDLVEVNTDLADEAGAAKTLEAARRLILACLGNYRGGRVMLQN